MIDAGWEKNERHTGGQDRVGRLEDIILYGNGKPGLTTRMADVEKDIKLMLDRESNRSKKMDRIEIAVWAAFLMMVFNLISTHIK